ncbi:MAG: serine acetyltransferase [Bacillota bacterium]|nr:serine acetyltransferase [Bacillota bacterium]
MRDKAEQQLKEITADIMNDYAKGRDIDKMNVFDQPERDVIVDIVNKMLNILFPGYYRDKTYKFYNLENKISVLIEDVMYNLTDQISIALEYDDELRSEDSNLPTGDACLSVRSQMLAVDFFKRVPKIRHMVNTDLQATFDGDPAADNKEEIVLCYPGLLASTIYRIAHELYELKVPIIPRMMTEYAHNITGIDIHPGATIGEYFFMDHGTGIVVGSTSVIGKHVKIYQGVTIGALSTSAGHSLHGTKRHPTIEDNVTIYSGASILGGETVIGEGSVIGGNVFLTTSVRPGTRVNTQNQEEVMHGDF